MPNSQLVLGIESSCDECSVALVRATRAEPSRSASNTASSTAGTQLVVERVETFSQIELHGPYGGVVPEIASRNHLETLLPLVERVLRGYQPEQLDAIAVTTHPGLIGALLVGVSGAKALAYAWRRPLVAINHLEAHAITPWLDQTPAVSYPLCLALISGGHTQVHVLDAPPERWEPGFLARSRVAYSIDDAAGEAFDKCAKLMGYPYPGGRWLEQASQGGDRTAFQFPQPLRAHDEPNLSFSGLKTAVALEIARLRERGDLDARRHDLCASVQEAIIDMLVRKIERAIERGVDGRACTSLAIVGGVAANRRLRERLSAVPLLAADTGSRVFFPKAEYCTDNAAMVAGIGTLQLAQGHALAPHSLAALTLSAQARAPQIATQREADR